MQKRVLLGWESGGGRGHAFILAWIARELRKRGFEPVLAVLHLTSLQSVQLEIVGIDCLQAPVWPGTFDYSPYWIPGPNATLADIFACAGLKSPSAVRYMLHAWDRLVALVKPDVVIANYSPALLMAAGGKVPSVAVGDCFTLPPTTMEHFPILTEPSDQRKYDEGQLLDVMNKCLGESSGRTISRLPEIFAADRSCVGAFTELDPYAAFRTSQCRSVDTDMGSHSTQGRE